MTFGTAWAVRSWVVVSVVRELATVISVEATEPSDEAAVPSVDAIVPPAGVSVPSVEVTEPSVEVTEPSVEVAVVLVEAAALLVEVVVVSSVDATGVPAVPPTIVPASLELLSAAGADSADDWRFFLGPVGS